ncbi:hydantoinase/oxoprolinase family protein [Yanghanlia caeni]|uniref:Hydantoinase/oxoprolinase family protein n=1 Tax=Yanghanlia caeni TaxID=3064283 RepID=A0ABU1D8W5_9BURK|nr:hydantoinase/oxoprolinase family protein [Alcaligenaceae bacterium LG-2]
MQIAVDIGGTFTDVVGRDASGALKYFKIPTTRTNESVAVLESIERIESSWGVPPGEISRFMHGTTVATNAILERKGARMGLLTTAGFKDVLAIGRQMRHQMYDAILESETPEFLIPGRRRKEVTERIAADGTVLVPLDEAQLMQAVDELVEDGVEAIAICFLFSFKNSAHERRARDLINEKYPDIALAVSHLVDPAFREYERTVVTAFDGYVKPVIDRYLSRLEDGFAQKGVTAPFQIMQSRGGLMASKIARSKPVRLFLSGPAGGVIGARITGLGADEHNLITVDIGGTSCDIALISDGKALIRSEGVIDGYPLRVPMVDVNSIGSGGGSIAWVDAAGGLRVGPESAGSEPGPACYGRGGERPTVTDASVVLGYIDPANFSGGALTLNPDLARKAIGTLAKELGMSIEETALGIHRIVNAQMAEGIRLVSIRQGLDPRQFAMMPLGGGGALHITPLARDLGITRVVVPPYPGVLAAAGLLAAPVEHEAATAYGQDVETLDIDHMNGVLGTLDAECSALMAAEDVDPTTTRIHHFADICYTGQGYTLSVELKKTGDVIGSMYEDFIEIHRRVYGYATRSPARIVNLRAVHQAGGSETIDSSEFSVKEGELKPGKRMIRVSTVNGEIEAAIYQRETLPAGAEFEGPAIVEQVDTTTLIEPGWHARVDEKGNLILTHRQD